MELKKLVKNCTDAVNWSLHPAKIEGAAKGRVYFQFGYARIEVQNGNGETIYDEFAS